MANGVPGFKGIEKPHSQAIPAEAHRCHVSVRGRYDVRPDSPAPSHSSSRRKPSCMAPTRNRWMESFGVVKDDPDGMAMARAHAAHAVTHVHPIYAFRSPHRAVMHGEDHGITLRERYHFCA